MKCNNCGSTIESGLVYCPKCGKSVDLVPTYNVLEEELLSKLVEDKDASSKDRFATGVYKPIDVTINTNPKSDDLDESKVPFFKRKNFFILFGILLVLILIIIFVLFYKNSNSYDYLLKQATQAEENASYSSAADYYKLALDQEETFEATYGLARMYYMAKEYQDSLRILREALAFDDTNTEIYDYIVKCYVALNDKQAIYELYNSAPSLEIQDVISQYIVAPPQFSLEPGDYDEEIVLFLTSKENYHIFYTTDGKDPTRYGKIYKESLKFSEGTHIVKAVCLSDDGQYSYITTGEYNVTVEKPIVPQVSSPSGSYVYPLCLTVTVPPNSTCYYTVDGSTPSTSSTLYDGQIIMPFGRSTLKVILYDSTGKASAIFSGDYDCQLATN